MKRLDGYYIKHKSMKILTSVVRYIFLACICYLFLFPMIYLLISSVQTVESMRDQSVIWVPKALTLSNFKVAAEMMSYRKSLLLTLVISVFATLATLFSCSMAGYGLARFKFAESKFIFALVLVLIIVPPQTTMMSTFLNYRFFNPLGLVGLFGSSEEGSINLINSPATMIIPAVFASGIRAGLMIFIFRQFFINQPKELEEAAKIDGCGVLKTFYKIMLPLSSPAIITVSVFSFVWYWNDSFYSSMFFNGDLKPLTAQLDLLRTTLMEVTAFNTYSPQEQKAYVAAGAILCIIPPLIIYSIIQRKFSESIERVGIVG